MENVFLYNKNKLNTLTEEFNKIEKKKKYTMFSLRTGLVFAVFFIFLLNLSKLNEFITIVWFVTFIISMMFFIFKDFQKVVIELNKKNELYRSIKKLEKEINY